MGYDPYDDPIAVRHYEELGGPGAWLGRLHAGRFVRSDVEPEDDGPPWMGRAVYLHGGDTYCDDCRELIDPNDHYGEAWVNVLARMKLKHGGTWCGDCFDPSPEPEDAGGESDESDERAGRTFD
ncbi:hypothetical protein M197_gp74 [Haloarcula hispanica tailed virus 2]|uniref:Uncharacterized protein n=1 Tax=Haloarcula hispanica tailed virus 2 TaxID=1273751 RepID=R4TM48_9CAUD|nr:hypothetical protein M197_gp74 [Haloarcula hispanica tailed virus 2]AGM11238.1 hypothetical protein HHTV2_74 [Haloarcula hispanica tailed virus 2]